MKKLYTTALTISLIANIQSQTYNWTKVSGILDSSNVKGIGVINNQILAVGQNINSSSQTDYALSNDGGNTWSKLPTYSFAGYLPNALPQNNLQICSNGFTFSKKLSGNTWQSFSGANNFAEFTNGSIIGSNGSFPDTVYNFSSAGIKGVKLGNYKFKLSPKYCNGANNRLFVFAYGVGLGYIDYNNLSVINFPATLDGLAMTESSWQAKNVVDMVQTANGNLFAADGLGYGIFKSIDNGVNWTTVYSESGSPFTTIDKNSTDELFVSVNGKVKKSSDLGITFTDISGNLPLGAKAELFVNITNEVFCFLSNGVSQSGIFKATVVIGVKENESNKIGFSVYPNPAKEILNVVLSSSITEPYNVIITNLLGEVVLTETATSNNFTLKVNNLKSGVYFVTLINKGKQSTKKLIIN